MPDSTYDASVAAGAFGDINEFRNNPRDFGENVTGIISETFAESPSSNEKEDLRICRVLRMFRNIDNEMQTHRTFSKKVRNEKVDKEFTK